VRAQRRLAILDAIRRAGIAQDQAVAEALDLSRTTVARERQALVAEGLVEPVRAHEGSHYPIAGWRLVEGA
jgi:DNA-binding IclR family transcriptional regulator